MSDLTLPRSSDSGDRKGTSLHIVAELESTRTRLQATEAVIEKMATSDDPVEQQMAELMSRTAAQIQEMYEEGRRRVAKLVAEAEALRELARRQAESATANAKTQLEERARHLMTHADALTESAQKRADRIVAEAEAHREATYKEVDDLLDEAEALSRSVDARMAEADAVLIKAREKASAILREASNRARKIAGD